MGSAVFPNAGVDWGGASQVGAAAAYAQAGGWSAVFGPGTA